MLRVKNPARTPENTALKAPASKNLCNDWVDKGNLVREGEEIEFYDYESGEYRYGEVQDIESSGSGAEVEVYHYESGEYRTFEME